MDDQELRQRLENIEQRVTAAFEAADKARKYLLVIIIITVAGLLLPLVGMLFAIPAFLSSFQMLEGL